jgi:hypothetical protein
LPGGNYEGIFNINVETDPQEIDIEFVEGPEAGNWNYGIFRLNDDTFELCLDLNGRSRPKKFGSTPGKVSIGGRTMIHARNRERLTIRSSTDQPRVRSIWASTKWKVTHDEVLFRCARRGTAGRLHQQAGRQAHIDGVEASKASHSDGKEMSSSLIHSRAAKRVERCFWPSKLG